MDCGAYASLMSGFLLGLSVLAQLHLSSVAGSALTVHKECGSAGIWYSWSPDGYEFFVGRKKVDDSVSLCQELVSYFASGCTVCKSHAKEWERLGKDYCGLDLPVFAVEESDACSSGNSSPFLVLMHRDCVELSRVGNSFFMKSVLLRELVF